MTIVKTYIDNVWFGNRTYIQIDNDLLRLHYWYNQRGVWEFTTCYAKRPKAKLFKGWERISYQLVEGDDYTSIEEMLFDVAKNNHLKLTKTLLLDQERLDKWVKFLKENEKNT